MGSSLVIAKQQLRSLVKTKLANLSQETITDQSKAIFETLKTSKAYLEAHRISIFLSMPFGEVQTDAIVRHALSAGKQVFIPYLHKSHFAPEEAPARIMDMVRLRDLQDYESLRRDKWGIPSIDPGSVCERQRVLGGADATIVTPSTLDLVLVPGVAFDLDPETSNIRRLGHGKGFYDFFIKRYSNQAATTQHHGKYPHPVLLYGLALSEQFLSQDSASSVPVGPHDEILDAVILGDGQVKRSSGVTKPDA